MATHGWWRHFDEAEPSPLPANFSEVRGRYMGVATSPPVYYLVGAAALKLTRQDSLVGQYYTLRWMALALAVPALLCIWAGTRRLFGVHVATGATLLTALHPQFVLMSTAVNPDVIVNLCGAVVWWQAARLVTGGPAAASMVLMACATLIAVFTKRVAVPLVLMLGVVPLVAVRFGRSGGWRAVAPTVGAVAGGMVLMGLAGVVWLDDEVARLRDYWAYLMTFSWSDQARSWAFFQRFTTQLFDSFWLVAGWLKYPAPPAWMTTVRLLTVGALVGCLIGARRPWMAQWRAGLVLAAALLGTQIAGVYVGLYMNGFGGQGRYLFPAMGPFMALFWIGIHGWWPQRWWPSVSAVAAALMFALDAMSWVAVLLPAYLG